MVRTGTRRAPGGVRLACRLLCDPTLKRAFRSSSSRTTAPLRSPPRCPRSSRNSGRATSWSWSTTTRATRRSRSSASWRPAAVVHRTWRNAGFAAGANAGAAAATGELLLFLNPDARPAPGFVEAIAAPLGDGRGWAAWMGLVTAEDGRVVNTNGGVVHFTGIAWAGEAGVAAPGSLTGAREAAFLSGACLAIPRTEWERAGGFAERYFMYFEDVDLSLRLRLAGGRLGVEPSAVVDHDYDVREGAGEVASARAQPLGDRRALLSRPAAARGRARAAGHRARAAGRRGGRAGGCRRSSAARPRPCSGCRDCCASAARSRRLARSPRASSRAGSHPTSTPRTSGAPGGWRRCAGRSARTGGSR